LADSLFFVFRLQYHQKADAANTQAIGRAAGFLLQYHQKADATNTQAIGRAASFLLQYHQKADATNTQEIRRTAGFLLQSGFDRRIGNWVSSQKTRRGRKICLADYHIFTF
jgi:hypothetical protein